MTRISDKLLFFYITLDYKILINKSINRKTYFLYIIVFFVLQLLFLDTPNIFTIARFYLFCNFYKFTRSCAHIVQQSESCVFDFLSASKYFIWTLGRVIHAVNDRYLSYRSYSNHMKIHFGSS